jgi:excisionase family DNA binding protein
MGSRLNYGGEEMWTAQQLAKRAGVSDAHIRRLLIRGEIEGEKFGHIWSVSDDEAARWLGERGIDVEAPFDEESEEE